MLSKARKRELKMINLIDDMKELIESLETAEEDNEIRELNDSQKDMIRNHFNTYINFKYFEDGGYAFIMSSESFKRFEYYLGFEYEKEYIQSKVEINGQIIVTYEYDSEKADDLFVELRELEEDEE